MSITMLVITRMSWPSIRETPEDLGTSYMGLKGCFGLSRFVFLYEIGLWGYCWGLGP